MRCVFPRLIRRWIDDAKGVCTGLRSERSMMRLRYSLLGAFVFCMAAHAFAYFNFAPIHDGVNYVSSFAGIWEVSLGRFMQPTYGKLHGEYTMPWFSGMLSMLYIGIAAFLVNDLFEVDNRWLALLTAGFLSANATMTCMTMVFPYVSDALAMALLLACAGAYAVIRMPNPVGMLLAGGCFAAAMGLYQSYALVGGLLLVLYAMLQAVSDRKVFAHQARSWLYYAGAVVLTAVLYGAAFRLLLIHYQAEVAPVTSYNSPARLASLDWRSFPEQIRKAYESFAGYFFGEHGVRLTPIQQGDIGLFALSGVLFVAYAVKERLPVPNVLLIAAGALLFPGAALAVSILTQDEKIYFLTAHALFLMYPALLSMLERLRFSAKDGQSIRLFARSRVLRACVFVLCGCILFGNIRYSNEMYTYRSAQYDKTISFITRLMERIDSVPEYERNETEVVLVGYTSAGLSNLKAPKGWEWMGGLYITSITYPQVLRSFAHMMGEQMNISLDDSEEMRYASMEAVKAMPCFPSPECCRMIDGKLVVKLTEY